MADDVSQPWLNDPQVQSTQSGYATTFADSQDLAAYSQAKARGASEEEALKVGDNGIGSQYLGGIRTPNVYGVAVPEEQLRQQFGDNYDQWRKARAVVNYGGQSFTVPIVDVGPGAEARAKGVVTDFTGPLSKALKSQGYDPAQISLIANGGPDYQSDPTAWYAEQQKIRSRFPDAGPWSKDPVAGQPKGEDKPWLNDQIVKQPEAVKPTEPWKAAPLASNHPIAKENGWTLAQSIQNIWDVAKTHLASNALATAKQRVVDNVPDQIVQQQIDAINASPYLSPEQKQANLKAIQDGQAKEKTDAQAEITSKQKEISDLEQSIKKNNPNAAEKVIGGTLPYLTSAAMGPLGPIQAAQQASAETYGDVLDSSAKRLKELHPDWNDGKVVTQAVKAATEASAGSGEAMLVLSVVDVPAAGPIIARIAQKIGIGAATMEVANSFAEVQKNMAIKKDVDPKEDWLGQLRNIEFHVQNIVTGGVFGGLHGLGGEIGRPSHVPIEDRVPIAEVPETEEEPQQQGKVKSVDISPTKEGKWQLTVNGEKGRTFDTEQAAWDERDRLLQPQIDEDEAQPRELSSESISYGKQGQSATGEKIVSAAVRVGGRVLTGPNHPLILEDAPYELGMSPGDPPLSAEHGFVTSTGRFVDRREAWEIANPNKEPPIFGMGSEDVTVQYPEPVTGTDPWLSSIANRYVEPRVAAGEIGEVTPGTGTTPQAEIARGTAMGPEQIAQHVSDLMQDKGNFRDHAAAVRAEEGRLSQESARLSRIAEANPNDPIAQRNAEDAFKYVTDFHNGPVAKLKNQWHAAGEAMQGQVEVDYGSFNGLREQWLKDVGKEPSDRVQTEMRDTARRVRQAVAAEDISMRSLGKEIEKPTRTKIPTAEEARANILARMRGDEPCGI